MYQAPPRHYHWKPYWGIIWHHFTSVPPVTTGIVKKNKGMYSLCFVFSKTSPMLCVTLKLHHINWREISLLAEGTMNTDAEITVYRNVLYGCQTNITAISPVIHTGIIVVLAIALSIMFTSSIIFISRQKITVHHKNSIVYS